MKLFILIMAAVCIFQIKAIINLNKIEKRTRRLWP